LFGRQNNQTADNSAILTQNAINISTATAQFLAAQTQVAGTQAQPTTGTGGTTEPTEPGGVVGGASATPGIGVTVTLETGGTQEPTTAGTTEVTQSPAVTEGTQVAEVTQVSGTASPTALQPSTSNTPAPAGTS